MVKPIRTSLVGVIVAFVLFFWIPCSTQTGRSQSETVNTQRVAVNVARTGDSCVFRTRDDVDSHPNCVLQDGQGKMFIAQDYVKGLEFDAHGLAVVFDDDHERRAWMYVDRRGRVIIQGVPIADNWADEFSDGLVRTVINQKYGFADRHGKIVIPAKYDGAFPFMHGYAVVCIGCRETCAMSDQPRADNVNCEHHILTGGEWFKIDKAGRVMAKVSR